MPLKHAAEQGADVFEGGKEARYIHFRRRNRPVRATYMIKGENGGCGNIRERISFDYLVDASGRKGVISPLWKPAFS